MYLFIEDGRIKEAFCGDIPENLKEKKLIEVSDDLDIRYDIPLSWYDSNWKIKPLQTLIDEGLYILSPYQKIENGVVVEKTEVELINEGLKELPTGKKIIDGEIVNMSLDEKLFTNQITEEEYLNVIRNKRDGLIQEVMWRVERYQTQKVLGANTNDSEETYKKILQYIQDLRDITTQSVPVLFPTLE